MPDPGRKRRRELNEDTGLFVNVADSVPGPTADIKLLETSGLLNRLPAGVGAAGDLAYVGIQALHPTGLAATPRRKPRGQERPPEDIAFNRAFAQRRIQVEHSIGFARRFEAITQTAPSGHPHHRRNHTARVVAVCGLANRRLAAAIASLPLPNGGGAGRFLFLLLILNVNY